MIRRMLAVAAALSCAVALAAGVATPAAAAQSPAIVSADRTVSGEPWSAPAVAVTCSSYGSPVVYISCEPNDSAQRADEACFQNVGAARATVCTTTALNHAALDLDGGDLVTMQSFACNPFDAACSIAESLTKAMAQVITGAVAHVLDQIELDTDSFLFTAALEEWSWWQGTVLLVILVAGIIGITSAAMSGRREELIGAIVRLALAFPLSQLAIVATGMLLNVVDGASMAVLMRNEQDNAAGAGLYGAIENVIYGGGGGNFWFATATTILLMLGAVMLLIVFSFRNIAFVALIAIAPIAFMLYPMKGIGTQWVIRWASAVAALLLTTPLTLGFVMLVLRGLGNVPSLWSIEAIPLGIGLILVGFAPMAVFALFSFVSGHAAAEMIHSAGGVANRGAQGIARSTTQRARSVFGRPRPGGAGRTPPPQPGRPGGGSPSPTSRQTPPPPPPRPTGPTGAPPAPSNPAPRGPVQ